MNAHRVEPDPADWHWRDAAACKERPDVDFFPEPGDPAKQAKEVCATCEVAGHCLTYALDNYIDHGIFGGTSARQRRILRTRRRRLQTR